MGMRHSSAPTISTSRRGLHRSFAFGALTGCAVSAQALYFLIDGPASRGSLSFLQLWALLWSGIFGVLLLLDIPPVGNPVLVRFVLCGALVVFYGLASMWLTWSKRRLGLPALVSIFGPIALHVGLYLFLVRATA
jgi:hypothetical protein